jgi:hypothetical protein
VAVAVQFHLSPLRAPGRPVWKRLEEMAFGLCKHAQGALTRTSVDAVSGLAEYPLFQLVVGIGQGAEVPQRKEISFDKFHSRFHAALLFWVPGRAWGDQKSVAFSVLRVGALDGRIMETGLDDGALGIVDDEALGEATVKELEGPTVASQPGPHLLIGDDLGVLMAAVSKGS